MILRWMVTKTKTAVWGGYDRTKTTKSQYGLPVAYRKSTKFDLEYSSHQRKPLKKQSKTGYLKQGINILKRVLGAGESFFNNCRWVTYSNRYLNSEMNLSEYKRQGIHLTKCWVNHTEHWQKKKKKKKGKLAIIMVLRFLVWWITNPGTQFIIGFWKSRDESLSNKHAAFKIVFLRIITNPIVKSDVSSL